MRYQPNPEIAKLAGEALRKGPCSISDLAHATGLPFAQAAELVAWARDRGKVRLIDLGPGQSRVVLTE